MKEVQLTNLVTRDMSNRVVAWMEDKEGLSIAFVGDSKTRLGIKNIRQNRITYIKNDMQDYYDQVSIVEDGDMPFVLTIDFNEVKKHFIGKISCALLLRDNMKIYMLKLN